MAAQEGLFDTLTLEAFAMDPTEVDKLCNELEDLIDMGPGENSFALRRVRAIAARFEAASNQSYVREKVREVVSDFERWFSPRKWRKFGPDGSKLRTLVYQSILKLRGAMETFGRPDS